MNGRGIFISLCVLGCACVLQAGWTQPVFLSELNDWEHGAAAGNPAVSSDGREIYFSRNVYSPSGELVSHGIFSAWRDDPGGTFGDERFIEELYNGMWTASPWLSADGLRLYYEQIEYANKIFQRFIKMAVRNKIGDPWIPVRKLQEIHTSFSESVDANPRLTPDELTIYWVSNRSGIIAERKMYFATRPSIFHQFGNIQEASAYNEMGASSPYFSLNNLAVYLAKDRPDGTGKGLWKGSRSDLSEPFAVFNPIEDLNQWGIATHSPWVSPDQRTIYFFQRWGEPGDATTMGICMSVWIPEPYDAAIENLEAAAELKQRSIDLIGRAEEKEKIALSDIGDLMQQTPGIRPEQIRYWQARMRIIQAMTHQAVARLQIREGIRKLAEAMALLSPIPQSPPVQKEKPEKNK
jgi:hypothetical protein